MLTDASPGIRPTLKPPPRFSTFTSGSLAARSSVMRVTRFHTSGSVPEPMWLCRRVIRTS